MDDAAGEEEASMFETSHVLGALLASSPLLARAWDHCAAATAAASGFVHAEDGGRVYVGFSGVQAALSAAGAAVAGGGADAFAPVGLGGDTAAGRMFAPLVAAEPDAAAVREPVAVQALALQHFLKLCGAPDFQMLLNQIKGKAVVFTGHSLGGAIASLAALDYLCISSSSSRWAPDPPVLCVTFGSPLLGNEALTRAILRERWGGNFCHVVSQHDIIPRLLFCPLDAIPAHIIVGMQLQQWSEWNSHVSAVTAVTACMSDPDKDVLRQLIQTHVGAVAMEQKLDTLEAPGGSPYRPFGTYVLCSPDGAACVDNPTAAVQMLYATFASRCSTSAESPEAAHSCYGELVLKMPKHLLLKRCLHVDDMSATPNYDAGVSLALEASGIDAMVRSHAMEASTARRWLKTSKRVGRRPSLNSARLSTQLGRITPFRAEIEWYKVLFDSDTGYYDAFKQQQSPKKFGRVNINRIKLGQFWDRVLTMLDAGQLPHDFHRRAKWVNAARFYQLLVEPLDIANYHRHNLHRTQGSYMTHGRERRYELFDRWWQEKGCTGARHDITSSMSTASASIRRRSKYAGLTQDPCFWARVEEAREQTESVRSERNTAVLVMKLEELLEFERYSSELVVSKEVSVDVLAPQSSYTLWVEQWNQLKLRDEVRTMLLQF